jgi:hypothetical protein
LARQPSGTRPGSHTLTARQASARGSVSRTCAVPLAAISADTPRRVQGDARRLQRDIPARMTTRDQVEALIALDRLVERADRDGIGGLIPTRGVADSLGLPKSSRVRIDGGRARAECPGQISAMRSTQALVQWPTPSARLPERRTPVAMQIVRSLARSCGRRSKWRAVASSAVSSGPKAIRARHHRPFRFRACAIGFHSSGSYCPHRDDGRQIGGVLEP